MNIDPNFLLNLHQAPTVGNDFSSGLVLTIPSTIFYNKGVKARDTPLDITVENDDGLIYFNSPNGAITLVFEIEELRAIMRLFDVPTEVT